MASYRKLRRAGGQAAMTVWQHTPFDLRRRLLPRLVAAMPEKDKLGLGLFTLQGVLELLRAQGFAPRTVIDIGANVGVWSRIAHAVFPSASFILIDGDPLNEVPLQQACRAVGAATSHIALLGPESHDRVTFHQMGMQSSVLPDCTLAPGQEVTLPMTTLDQLVVDPPTPLLLKLDVQGYELEVLRGGRVNLERAGAVILETSLLQLNEGAPLIAEVIAFMQARGFCSWDFCGQLRAETDHTLYQVDIVFVPHDSPLRAPRPFWKTDIKRARALPSARTVTAAHPSARPPLAHPGS
jgi:FkbM family methyltransferase